MAALSILGVQCGFMGFRDDDNARLAAELPNLLRTYGELEMVFAPAPEEGGHPHHNLVGEVAGSVFKNVTYYMTYTNRQKSHGVLVPYEKSWPLLKLKALACYESQVNEPSTQPHFMNDYYEYYKP